MAVDAQAVSSKDMKNEDLLKISNIFASEFNSEEIHDRVLCFQIIDDTEVARKDDPNDSDDSHEFENEAGSESSSSPVKPCGKGLRKRSVPLSCSEDESNATDSPIKSARMCSQSSSSSKRLSTESCFTPEPSKDSASTPPTDRSNSTNVLTTSTNYGTDRENKENSNSKETIEQIEDGEEQYGLTGEEQELQNEGEERQETTTSYQSKEIEGSSKNGESKTNENENKSIVSKFFVHSQWLAVQSPYFKALFYSGMKETYSKEVIMKIYEHELEAHQTLIEAMYKLDVLSDKNYRLVVQVLVLAHKYDVRHVFMKCKYVLLSTTPSLEMCEYILKEIKHLPETADIHEMLEKFLVKEFTPIDDTWTLTKFTDLSEAALRLLLRSDNLGTRSENTIFVALIKWVRTNLTGLKRTDCDLLSLVRFEFMSVNFLHDVVQEHILACQMPGYHKYLVKGLAYHGFSEIRREQLEPQPKKRLLAKDDDPTFSWVIDEEIEKNLSQFPERHVTSNEFWCKGYKMELHLTYKEHLKCSFYLRIYNRTSDSRLCVSYKARSILFASHWVCVEETIYKGSKSSRGKKNILRDEAQTGKGYTIDVWVNIK